MNEMDYRNERNYRDYRDYREDYREDGNYRNERSYRDEEDYRDGGSYRDYRDYRNYREDYRKRDYDRRGGKINNRNNRSYRNQDYYEELEMLVEDIREGYRKIEDVAEMAENQQDKNMLTKIAQKEKENYTYLKQLMDK